MRLIIHDGAVFGQEALKWAVERLKDSAKVSGRYALVILERDIGPMLQQQCHSSHVYINNGDHVHQCGHSSIVLCVDARVGVDERFHDTNV